MGHAGPQGISEAGQDAVLSAATYPQRPQQPVGRGDAWGSPGHHELRWQSCPAAGTAHSQTEDGEVKSI